MKTLDTSKEGVNESKAKTLEVFCSDSVGVKVRMTFDSCKVEGVQITYWQDDEQDVEARVDSMFAILFEEMERAKKLEQVSDN